MEVLDKIIDILTTPIVLGGVGTLTIGSAIAIVLKAILGAKKGEVLNLTNEINKIKGNESSFATKDEISKLNDIVKRQNALLKKQISSVKNEKVKQELELERQEIENDIPQEIVVDESIEEVAETKKARF